MHPPPAPVAVAQPPRAGGVRARSRPRRPPAPCSSATTALEERIAQRLEGAGSAWRPAEWLLFHSALFIGISILGLLIGGGSLIIGVIFMADRRARALVYLGFRRKRRKKKFEAALPETLQLMSGSLAAGLSLAQSVDTIVREGTEPIAGEFRKVLVETRLGSVAGDRAPGRGRPVPEQGLRLGRDGHQHPAAGRWQPGRAAEHGGRHHARARVHPPPGRRPRRGGQALGDACWAACRRRSCSTCCSPTATYVIVLFTRPLGILMLVGGAVILSVGIFWMSRIVKVEV